VSPTRIGSTREPTTTEQAKPWSNRPRDYCNRIELQNTIAAEHPFSIATHGSAPSRHPRLRRGCRLGAEGSWVCPTPGITIPGKELPSLRDSVSDAILV
jgi:hypothetical protein